MQEVAKYLIQSYLDPLDRFFHGALNAMRGQLGEMIDRDFC